MNFELDSLEAVLTGLVSPDAPRVDKFVLTSGRASLVPSPFSLRLPQPAKAKATVTSKDLADFLEKKAGAMLGRPELEISGGAITLKGKAKVVFVEVPVTAVCTLEIVRQTELHVRIQSVDVGGGAAKALLEGFLEKQNPILSTSQLPFPVKLTRVILEHGLVTLEGEALPPS
jgi:hypothetical protein